MYDITLVLVIALILDVLFGDPVYRFHPVRLMGDAITGGETRLRQMGLTGIVGGGLLAFSLLGFLLGGYLGLRWLLANIHPWLFWALDIYLVYSCLALRDLLSHARKVAAPLNNNDLPQARNAVQMIIGRDAEQLDAAGVARAVIESLAESFVDGFLSPLFWFVLGGLIAVFFGCSSATGSVGAILAYKMVNTLDSMVGYRSEQYIYFGRVGARLDDIMNFIPARLAIPVITFAAVLCRLNPYKGWIVGRRDRLKHASPNAGHAESCVAGALEIRLGGPGIYFHGIVDKPWMGDGTAEVTGRHISNCLRLISCAGLVAAFFALFSLSFI